MKELKEKTLWCLHFFCNIIKEKIAKLIKKNLGNDDKRIKFLKSFFWFFDANI